MRQIIAFVSVLTIAFLTCGTLQADAAPQPPQKHHQAGKKKSPKPKSHNKSSGKLHNDKAKAIAKDRSKDNPIKQIVKPAVVKKTVVVDETAGTLLVTPGHHHEPQAVSDAQLQQAQRLLLTLPTTLEKLQQAHALLLRGNWNYDGHRARAQEAVEYAISELPTDPDEAAVHIKKAARELDIALRVN